LDDEVLAFAVTEKRAVLSLKRKDFRRLHRDRPQHEGIVICTVDADFERQATSIDNAIAGLSLAGQLIRVNRPPL
jgi:hypothetical protein